MARWILLALLLGGCEAATEEVARTPRTPALACPDGTRFEGERCVWQWYVAEVRCPRGSRWRSGHCEAREVRCPAGARWDGVACIAPLLVAPDTRLAPRRSDPPAIASADGLEDPFAGEAQSEARPLPPASDGVIDPFAQTEARARPMGADELIDPWSLEEMRH
jgi:hypothetical protein